MIWRKFLHGLGLTEEEEEGHPVISFSWCVWTMEGFQDLRQLFRRRLQAAVNRDLCGPRETLECQEELQRQRRLLAVILTPEIKLQRVGESAFSLHFHFG